MSHAFQKSWPRLVVGLLAASTITLTAGCSSLSTGMNHTVHKVSQLYHGGPSSAPTSPAKPAPKSGSGDTIVQNPPALEKNSRLAMSFFERTGKLPQVGAAGVVSNLIQQSWLNPNSVLHTMPRLENGKPNPLDLVFHGIALWDPLKWKNENIFAANHHESPAALTTQLQFLLHDMSGHTLRQLKGSTSLVDKATKKNGQKKSQAGSIHIFASDYLHPANYTNPTKAMLIIGQALLKLK